MARNVKKQKEEIDDKEIEENRKKKRKKLKETEFSGAICTLVIDSKISGTNCKRS